jgi:hypothetical protein
MAERVWRVSDDGRGRVWVMREQALRELLARVAGGEDPELVLLEEYANASMRGQIKPEED